MSARSAMSAMAGLVLSGALASCSGVPPAGRGEAAATPGPRAAVMELEESWADRALRPDGEPVPALSAATFLDTVGIGVHLAYEDTPYADAGAVAALVRDLGVRHLRDDLFLGDDQEISALRQVAQVAGAELTLISGTPDDPSPAAFVGLADTALPGLVAAWEGPNEWDRRGGDSWAEEAALRQRELSLVTDGDVLLPSLAGLGESLPELADAVRRNGAAGSRGVSNGHFYPRGATPESVLDQLIAPLAAAFPDQPLVLTEAGYHDAIGAAGGRTGGGAASPRTIAAYLPRMLLENVRAGVSRTFLYELIDQFPDDARRDPESNFGLVEHDLTPKPAYESVRALLDLAAGTGVGEAAAPARIEGTSLPDVSTSPSEVLVDAAPAVGETGGAVRALLLRRSRDEAVLLLWRPGELWDPVRQQPLRDDRSPVTVSLPPTWIGGLASYAVHGLDPGAPVRCGRGSAVGIRLGAEVMAIRIGVRIGGATGLVSPRTSRGC